MMPAWMCSTNSTQWSGARARASCYRLVGDAEMPAEKLGKEDFIPTPHPTLLSPFCLQMGIGVRSYGPLLRNIHEID